MRQPFLRGDGFLGALPLKYPAALCPLRLRFAQTGTGGSPAGSLLFPGAVNVRFFLTLTAF